MKTKAAAALDRLCSPVPAKVVPAELARDLDVPPQAVHAWRTGAYKPKLSTMLELEKLLGIPVKDWTR